ncbi:MAG: ribbon-helix-helix domain-containing protein [Actinomycetota bacterium]|nr:ribbon-helix-helix domain-containing protein [Actinomycetota bacterium]
MTIQVPVRLTERDVAALDRLVAEGAFATRSDALRAGLAGLLRERRERDIEAAYRRGYEAHPQETWVADVGLAGLAEFHRAEGGDPL